MRNVEIKVGSRLKPEMIRGQSTYTNDILTTYTFYLVNRISKNFVLRVFGLVDTSRWYSNLHFCVWNRNGNYNYNAD